MGSLCDRKQRSPRTKLPIAVICFVDELLGVPPLCFTVYLLRRDYDISVDT